jgi:hypothetical protein
MLMEITSVFSLTGICRFTLFLLHLSSLTSVSIYIKTVCVETMNLSTFPPVEHVIVLLIILTKISVYNFVSIEKELITKGYHQYNGTRWQACILAPHTDHLLFQVTMSAFMCK